MFLKATRVALIVAVSGVMVAAYAGAVYPADFSGTWVLNEEESEMPQPPGGGHGPGGGGRPPGGDGERGQGGRGGRGGMGGQISGMTITQQEDVITIVAEGPRGSREQVLKPGAGPQDFSTPRGDGTKEVSWEGHKLIVTRVSIRETPRGEMRIEQNQTWELSEDGQTLTQDQQINTPRGTFDIKLVFNKE